ncbi:hypothetical protein [Acidocella sp.]|uniref:hypothetical protein n=1 Tax=Acidocella sp. TaxID=50710 RepID=UPI002620D764|nr:hypothetical protein [Acidocella sp.]MDD2794667.1 hypothetical protein [Acidocella sp.]
MSHYGLAHLIVATIIKGVIYSTIWHVMRGLPVVDDVVIAGVVIAAVWIFGMSGRAPRRWRP